MPQKQSPQPQPEKKNGRKPEPVLLPDQASELTGVAEMPGGLLGAAGEGTIDAQVALLKDTRLRLAQRQAIVAQIGKTQGNQHLQRAIVALKDGDEEGDAKHEKKVKELVTAGKYDEAIKYIADTYGFTGDNFDFTVVEDNELPGAWATTSGEIKKGAKQTLKIKKNLFNQTFPFIVRTIGHEFQHVKQRSGETPITNQPEREFLSWAWEALDTSVPGYPLDTAAYHAKKALEYFDKMPAEPQQKQYAEKKKELEELIKKAEEEKKKEKEKPSQ